MKYKDIFNTACVSPCRGCGFVQFPDERLQKRALEECQGAVGLGAKPLRLSLAANKWVLLKVVAPFRQADLFVPGAQAKLSVKFSSVSPSLWSLRNKQQQQPSEHKSWQSSSGYRHYDQYNQYQQQAYPGFYSSWGYDQTGGGYGYNYQQYDYTQCPPPQVSSNNQRYVIVNRHESF